MPGGILDNNLIDPSNGCRLDNYILPQGPSETFSLSDWKELVFDETPFNDEFVENASQAFLKLTVDWARLRGLLILALGIDWVEGPAATARLRRILPIAHPLYPWMRCVGASVRGVMYGGGTQPVPANVLSGPLKTSVYVRAEVTLRFRNTPYLVLTDEQVYGDGGTNEWQRFVTVTPDFQPPEQLSSNANDPFKFIEGPLAGSETQAPFGTLKLTSNYQVRWWRVPSSWSSTFFRPKRLERFRGTINNREMFGFGTGTLLWMGCRFEEFTYPVQVVFTPAIGHHITMEWWHFDPENTVPGATIFGHNTLPLVSGSNFYWAGVSRDGTNTGARLWPIQKDFADAFNYWNAP